MSCAVCPHISSSTPLCVCLLPDLFPVILRPRLLLFLVPVLLVPVLLVPFLLVPVLLVPVLLVPLCDLVVSSESSGSFSWHGLVGSSATVGGTLLGSEGRVRGRGGVEGVALVGVGLVVGGGSALVEGGGVALVVIAGGSVRWGISVGVGKNKNMILCFE